MARVKVIIVNYNAGEILAGCVDAVLSSSIPVSVSVADNNSTDDSLGRCEDRFADDPRVEVLRNRRNLGFASAVNRLASAASEQYILVLNPDCILDNDALERLVAALDDDPQAGVAGPWVTDSQGTMQKGTWRTFPDPWRSLMTVTGLHRLSRKAPSLAGVDHRGVTRPQENTRVDAVSGACLLLRRSAAERVGFYDEGYAMHCEDLDLMYRLAALGHYCILVPSARAVHSGGVSSASRPWWVHRQKHAGMQRYFQKFQAASQPLPVRWMVNAGIWAHYIATLPLVLFRQLRNSP